MELVLGLGGVISVPDKATFDLQDAVLVGAGRHPVLVGRVASGSIFHGDCLRVLMDDGTVSECRVWHFVGVFFHAGYEWEKMEEGDNTGLLVDSIDIEHVVVGQEVDVLPGNRPTWTHELGLEPYFGKPSWA